MKNYLLILFSLLLLLSPRHSFAQSVPEQSAVVMSPDELSSMVRKLVVLRNRRLQHLRARQAQMMQGRKVVEMEVAVEVDRIENDTTIQVSVVPSPTAGRSSYRSDTVIEVRSPSSEDYTSVLNELRDRLDRQEELLLEMRDERLTAVPQESPRRDTIIQQIIQRGEAGGNNSLTESELRNLSREVAAMNDEMARLRDRLRDEEIRRRGAENRLQLQMRNDEIRRRDAESRLRAQLGSTRPPETQVIRDTIYVERQSVQPVMIPTTPARDTVVIYRDSIREVAAPTVVRVDTVVQEKTVREEVAVVKRDTVQLEAREPISFPAIFFDNNSSTLNANHRRLLATAAEQLEGRTNYVIRLTGYASPSGNAAYNQQLSERRAQAVRDGLAGRGIDLSRIIIVAGGIDFQPANAAAARRVEVQAVPR